MPAIIEILFSRDSSRNHSHVHLGRISTVQSYLVHSGLHNLKVIAIICGPALSMRRLREIILNHVCNIQYVVKLIKRLLIEIYVNNLKCTKVRVADEWIYRRTIEHFNSGKIENIYI